MPNQKKVVQFTILTFCIAYLMSGILIILGQFGCSVQSSIPASIQSLPHLLTNILFAVYILSPALASLMILKQDNTVISIREWLLIVFHVKNSLFIYLFISVGLALYFWIHIVVSDRTETILPFYLFFLNLPGNLFIGGLEEAGWSYILQPELDKKYGYALSSLFTGIIWLLWHIPLFFISGTSHEEGLIDFWMFAVQIIAFRYFYGAIYKVSGKGRVFMCVLCHTMFNAASAVLVILPMTWKGTIAANAMVVFISCVTVMIYNQKY